MKKQIIIYASVLFLLFTAAIVMLQVLRLDLFHQWFPANSAQGTPVETMSTDRDSPEGEQLHVYIHKNKSSLSEESIDNLKYAMDYAKVPYEDITKDEMENLNPSPYSVLVLSGEHSEEWPYEAVRSFVNEGGNLYVASRFIDADWNELIGLADAGDFKDGLYGLTFEKEIFPGYMDLGSDSELFSHSIADVELAESAEVYIEAEDHPILWSNTYGDGNVMFWNTTSVTEKSSRGLMLQALSFLPPTFVSSQAGIKVMHIDDFPAPVPSGTTDVIQRDYDLDVEDFYSDVWWEDMKRIGEEEDVIYTGYLIGTYQDTMDLTSEELIETRRFPMLYFGRKVLKEDGEIGIHGYNHQSLVTADEPIDPEYGYRPWKNQAEMEDSLHRVDDLFDYYFKEEDIHSYVPPSNVLNKTGVRALHEVFPDLETVSGLYTGDKETGAFLQEYEPNSEFPSIYHFPRISSGYGETDEERFVQIDAIANFGVFAHFIHPDDVLDPNRSGDSGWPEMRQSYEDMLHYIHDHYTHLKGMRQTDATKKMTQYQASDIAVTYQDNQIIVQGDELLSPSTILIRVNDGSLETGSFEGGDVKAFGESGTLYQVTLKQPYAEFKIKDEAL
ncbi:DUF2194 domain-containing protein [Halobacillus litoralis]|uniref:DUF2194 domain-containing protein n=1 Tax=Halobacillus litoralis TaxID=45668 RepID=UPI001CD3EFB0|nr:DUF2194 domain-containing protein [Halobacillus litoralis]MCA1022176.1 DUF2194 domain-containing protein [Halobacillus litoralis]